MSKNKKYTLNLEISMQVEVSQDYLERMAILPIEWAFEQGFSSELPPQSPLFRSVLNQCFKNNRRTLDKLFIDSIEVKEEQ